MRLTHEAQVMPSIGSWISAVVDFEDILLGSIPSRPASARTQVPLRALARLRSLCCFATQALAPRGPLPPETRPVRVGWPGRIQAVCSAVPMSHKRRPFAGLLTLLLLVGCTSRGVDQQAAGDILVREFRATYPEQIRAIGFEYSPPLDPPTLYVDLEPAMSLASQRAFLCGTLWPRIKKWILRYRRRSHTVGGLTTAP